MFNQIVSLWTSDTSDLSAFELVNLLLVTLSITLQNIHGIFGLVTLRIILKNLHGIFGLVILQTTDLFPFTNSH